MKPAARSGVQRPMRVILCVVLIAFAPGCAPRSASRLPQAPEFAPQAASLGARSDLVTGWDSPGIDLKPGWRLRVITPLLKSGGYQLRPTEEQVSGNTVTLSGGEELEGYETATYAVESKSGGGVQIAFVSAEVTRKGQTAPQLSPARPLFQLPSSARFVRLLYLTRVSAADHDMAVVAAGDSGTLERLTAEVQASQLACKSSREAFCEWIPPGIAVRPEARTFEGGAERWGPVR